MDIVRPRIGDLALLVYRECVCGEWCATGEGAGSPLCGRCGRRMVAFSVRDRDARRERGLGFVAFLTQESGAVGVIAKVRGFLGIREAGWAHGGYLDADRHYPADEVRDWLVERNVPTEAQFDSHSEDAPNRPPWEAE